MNSTASFSYDEEHRLWRISGDWRIHQINRMATALPTFTVGATQEPNIDGSAISHMDTTGAWVLQHYLLCFGHSKLHFQGFKANDSALLQFINTQTITPPLPPKKCNLFEKLGQHAHTKYQQCHDFLHFIGELTITLGLRLGSPRQVQWRAIAHTIETMGYRALPLVGFLSLLIGIVLTYQMGLQLKTYGANIYIVDLLGLSILREFGPLMTAILLAGRTASAFTAELGTMIINQEIDALETMGIRPMSSLILPRITALMLIMPLLTVCADLFGLLGGMIMSKSMLHISFYDFLQRFQDNVGVENYLIGLGKAPVFGAIIAGIGCFQGLQVSGSADSVGKQTTVSVVQSIFLIIITDAIFSIFFTLRGI